MNIRRLLYPLLRLYWRVLKPTTLGSRVLVVKDDQVLLVRLSYVDGWYLPGGGVDRGESFEQAARRELREECALEARSSRLFGLYTKVRSGKVDHVAVYLIDSFEEIPGARPDAEIVESKFFPARTLPPDATPATKRRILEWLEDSPPTDHW